MTVTELAPKARALPIDKNALREMEKEIPADDPEREAGQPGEAVLPEIPVSEADSADVLPEENISEAERLADQEEAMLPETADGYADGMDEDIDFDEDPDDEDIPYVSDELIQRMSALWHDPEALKWLVPAYDAAPP